MIKYLRINIAFACCVFLATCHSEPDSSAQTRSKNADFTTTADMILFNAKVYSLNWGEPDIQGLPAKDAPIKSNLWHPDASTIVVGAGKILFVGEHSEALKWQKAETKMVDVEGATVIPGLVDSHVHIAELGEVLSHANLIGVESPQQAIDRLLSHKQRLKPGQWLVGQGWDEGAWANNYPDRFLLDKAFPDNPVYLKSLHGFAVWVNSRALKSAGINGESESPVGGEILKGEDGNPSGILLNRATTLMHNAVPEPSDEEFKSLVLRGLKQMAIDGYVAVHQAGADSRHIKALQTLRADGELPIRVYAMLSARDLLLTQQWLKIGPYVDEEGWLDIRSVKAYYDGALGSRGARLLADYSDKPGHRGVSGDGYGFDAEAVAQLMRAGFQVGIHAIGDAGNRETLDYIADVYELYPETRLLRNRIEHAQVIHVDDFKRFADLSLIASMEPPHAVEDKAWAEQRLGAERVRGAYAWRSLRQANVALTFNSDLPGSDHNIFYGLHAAVTRRDKNAEPTQGWYPEQNLTMEESIRAYTHWAAFAAFREKQTGKIAPGYWADLTIMDIDPFMLSERNPAELLNGKVLMTIVNGDIVHESSEHD